MERSCVSLSDMNNPRFTDSELIKDVVDDMEECLEHFESGEDSLPMYSSLNVLIAPYGLLCNRECFLEIVW